jgi:hypothetical protein
VALLDMASKYNNEANLAARLAEVERQLNAVQGVGV